MLRAGSSASRYKTLPYTAVAQTIKRETLSEEMRILYVALTRAQDAVFVSHAAQRHLYGKALELPPSRFLSALPELFRHTRLVRHVQTKATQMKLF